MPGKSYPSEARAFRRVQILTRDFGIWPGVMRCGNRWVLTEDPDTTRERADVQLAEVQAEYQEDIARWAWLPDDD